jgi:GNAT superfamily N-acetyltransferase
MIFESLHHSAQAGDLILEDGLLCHFHLRRDGILTIRELIVLPAYQRQGRGRAVIERLAATPGALFLQALCPLDLPVANAFYRACGFHVTGHKTTRTGKEVAIWQRLLP